MTVNGKASDAELDDLVTGICLAAFEATGSITPAALDLAAEAVLATDAIAGSAETMLSGSGQSAGIPVTGGRS